MPGTAMTFKFSAEIGTWRGPSPYFFVTVPPKQCSRLAVVSTRVTYGWGRIPVTVSVSGKGALPAEAQAAFYRLCQEGLNNIARHSKARNAQIQLQYGPEDGAVKLRIHDDGRGFEPEKIQSGHYGLTIMRERAAAVGAVLSIESQPGKGTDLVMRWVPSSTQEVA